MLGGKLCLAETGPADLTGPIDWIFGVVIFSWSHLYTRPMVVNRVRSARKFWKMLLKARKKYLGEATPETYSTKNAVHHHFSEEREVMISGRFPNRALEIRELVLGEKVIEAGCAEGIQSIALGQTKEKVWGFDISPFRVDQAQRLLSMLPPSVAPRENVIFKAGAAEDFGQAFREADSLLAARVIYHYRSKRQLNRLMEMCSKNLTSVVFVGDRAKSRAFDSFKLPFPLNPVKFWFFAGREGMQSLLNSHGFSVELIETSWGDPVAIGRKDGS